MLISWAYVYCWWTASTKFLIVSMFWLNRLYSICSVSRSLTLGYHFCPKKCKIISSSIVIDLLFSVLLSKEVFSIAVKKAITKTNPPWVMKALQNSAR